MFDKWLLDVKVGDKLVVLSGGWGDTYTIVKVVRVTNTHITVKYPAGWDQKWSKQTGRKVPHNIWQTESLRQITPEIIQEMKIQKLKYEAKVLKSDISIPEDEKQLKKFVDALRPFMRKKEDKKQ